MAPRKVFATHSDLAFFSNFSICKLLINKDKQILRFISNLPVANLGTGTDNRQPT
jgi:hypothetical protein